MNFEPDKWAIINELAESEGVPKETRKKWRVRGVPASWQIKFVKTRPADLSFDDFGTSVAFARAEGDAA